MSVPLTPEQKDAILDYFRELDEAVRGAGSHEGHELSQAGRCVYCSCGFRLGQLKLRGD